MLVDSITCSCLLTLLPDLLNFIKWQQMLFILNKTKKNRQIPFPVTSCCYVPTEELVENDDEDNLSQVMRHRATIPWRSCGKYLSSAGLLLLPLLLLSQLLKHSFMVVIDVWLAHWTSDVIHAKINAVQHNCTLVQVHNTLLQAYSIDMFVFLEDFSIPLSALALKNYNKYVSPLGWLILVILTDALVQLFFLSPSFSFFI